MILASADPAGRRLGRGRVLAFLGVDSWRWHMELEPGDRRHELFWGQPLRWLVPER